MNLAAVRDSELYDSIEEDVDAWAAALERLQPSSIEQPDETDQDILGLTWYLALPDSTQWVVSAGTSAQGKVPGTPTPAIKVVRAELRPEQVEELLRLEAGVRGGDPSQLALQGDTLGRRPAWIADELVATELEPDVWLIGDREMALEVIARATGDNGPPVDTQTAHLDRAVNLFEHDIGITTLQPNVGLAELDGGALAAELGDGAEVTVALRAPKGQSAEALARRLEQDMEAYLARGPHLFGSDRLVRRLQPQADGQLVRMGLSLDADEARVYWGRLSGAVSTGIWVAEMVLTAFNTLVAQVDRLDAQLEQLVPDDLDLRPRQARGVVLYADEAAPVSTGAECLVRIEPHPQPPDDVRCRATVVCGEGPLYGADGHGWLPCEVDAQDPGGLRASDLQSSGQDGDPALEIDMVDGVFSISDDGSGEHGKYELGGDLESVEIQSER
ncbi:MAG: hypothetical protein ACOCUS_00685 [Polyangiales bacterium]